MAIQHIITVVMPLQQVELHQHYHAIIMIDVFSMETNRIREMK
jgi:hypothetical protein